MITLRYILHFFTDIKRIIKSYMSSSYCINCGGSVVNIGLCAACWVKINRLIKFCKTCGVECNEILDTCKVCNKKKIYFDLIRSYAKYDHNISNTIIRFKYNQNIEYANVFARLICSTYMELIKECDILVPIPLHWTRRLSRGYNQAELLAIEISKISGVPYSNIIKRTKRTNKQGYNGIRDQLKESAFEFAKTYKDIKTIGIIDDVIVSGQTINVCSHVIKQNMKVKIFAFSVARGAV